MWIQKKHTSIALALLLTSCGASAAAPSDVSTAPEPTAPLTAAPTPAVTTPAPITTDKSTPTSASSIPASEAAFPARLAVIGKGGNTATFSPGSDPIVTDGLTSPTGDVVVSSDTFNNRSNIEWHRTQDDRITAMIQIEGEFRPTAVAQDGELVALTGRQGNTTTVVLATPTDGEVRRWTFDAVLVPEAFANAYEPGSSLPIGVFVIEYLDTNTYRVRVIDTATGELGLPLNLRDKSQLVDEVMTAVSRTAVFDPMNQMLFTLYQDATEGGENVGSFIHTLGLVNGVWCLDVPRELGLSENPGALAVSPDGSRLFAASSIGGIAGYQVSDITTSSPEMPEARTTTAVDATAPHVAIAASRDQVILALGGSLFRLDPDTLEVRDSFTWDMDVEAMTLLDDGSAVIVGTGRMTLISPDNTLLAERTLPTEVGEVTRVAVID
jgi:hypothetical protein